MTEEFNLSEKEIANCEARYPDRVIRTEDVKEFIRLLDKAFNVEEYSDASYVLKKLAGDKLI